MDLTSTVPNVTLCSHWPQHAMTKQPEVMHFQRQIAIRVARGEATICDSEWEGQSKQCKTLEWHYASRKWKILATTKGSERLGYICPTVISVFLIPDTGSQSQLPNQPMTFTLLSLKCMTCLNRILSVFMLQMVVDVIAGISRRVQKQIACAINTRSFSIQFHLYSAFNNRHSHKAALHKSRCSSRSL